GDAMSYLVTRLVRASRLPPTVPARVRPAAKAVLLALADACHDDGRGPCHPSLATLAREADLSRSGVIAQLRHLQDVGLIVERHPPTKHRPRTWGLDLTRLATLIDPDAWLSESDTHLVRRLRAAVLPLSGASADPRPGACLSGLSRPEDRQPDLFTPDLWMVCGKSCGWFVENDPSSCPEDRQPDLRGLPGYDTSDPATPLNGDCSQSQPDPYGMYGIQNGKTVAPRDDRRYPPPEALATLHAIKAKVFAKSQLPLQRLRRAQA